MLGNLQEILNQVIVLVKEVGTFQLSHFRTNLAGGGTEKIKNEFVSFVDIESEVRLKRQLQSLVPNSGFFGEETTQERANLEWIVDPIDGTTNYLSGLPLFTISVALYENGSPSLAAVYQPTTGDLFSAISGQGLLFNQESVTQNLSSNAMVSALIGSGFPYRSKDLQNSFFPACQEVLNNCRGIRRMGSAALDLSSLATGFIQGFWESDLQPYDVAAALLFLKEREVTVTNEKGEPYQLERDRILVAGYPTIHQELLKIIQKHYL
jgi:myo-inositol-1(or 4)-monophosphatase